MNFLGCFLSFKWQHRESSQEINQVEGRGPRGEYSNLTLIVMTLEGLKASLRSPDLSTIPSFGRGKNRAIEEVFYFVVHLSNRRKGGREKIRCICSSVRERK